MANKRIIGLFWLTAGLGMVAGGPAGANERGVADSPLTFSQESVEFHLEKVGGHSLVKVDFGDGTRHSFIIDTGAPTNVIDERLASAQGYEVVGQRMVGSPGGNPIPAKVVRIPEVRLGEAIIKNAEFVVVALDQMSRGLMQGVLGMSLFKGYLLTIDQGNGRVVVSRGSLSPGGPGVIAYESSDDQIQFDIDVAGQPVPVNLDTGAPGYFTLPAALKQTLPLQDTPARTGTAELTGGTHTVETARLNGEIEFADLRFEDPTVAFIDSSTTRGNIGNGILDTLEISLDQGNRLIAIHRSIPQEHSSQPTGEPRVVMRRVAGPQTPRRRLGIRFQGTPGGGQLIVAGVDPGSISEQAGFRAGDRIIAINDRPCEELDVNELGSLLGSASPLKFQLERNGESLVIDVQ